MLFNECVCCFVCWCYVDGVFFGSKDVWGCCCRCKLSVWMLHLQWCVHFRCTQHVLCVCGYIWWRFVFSVQNPSGVIYTICADICSSAISCRLCHLDLLKELFCCCRPTPPCLYGGVLPYLEVTGHPVSVSSLGFKCPDCFIWNCNYIVYPSKMKGPFRDNCLRYFLPRIGVSDGWMCGRHS